jgi:hypothetical protein
MTTENLKFKVQLYAQYWDIPPIAEILVGQNSMAKQEITGTEQNPTLIEFYSELTEGQQYNFTINRTNKFDSQTQNIQYLLASKPFCRRLLNYQYKA